MSTITATRIPISQPHIDVRIQGAQSVHALMRGAAICKRSLTLRRRHETLGLFSQRRVEETVDDISGI